MLVVIGTGHSGTRNCASLWNLSHEVAFRNREGFLGWVDGTAGEASMWAPLYLPRDDVSEIRHVVREPLAAANSLARYKGMCLFGAEHCPQVPKWGDADPFDVALAYWVWWNRRCADLADVTIRLEDLPRVGSTPRPYPKVRDELSGPFAGLAAYDAARYGYG